MDKWFKTGMLLFMILLSCSSKESRETQFSIANPELVNKIEISGTSGFQSIKNKNDRWWLNDTIKVRQDAMENILRILPSIKVKIFPPKSSWEFMIKAILEEGVKIRFYTAKNKLLKSLLIGGTTNDERGTYAMLEGSSQPYIIHVPGFEGSLASRFILREAEWRDRMIIEENPDDIHWVQVDYFNDSRLSFRIEQKSTFLFTVTDQQHQEILASVPLIKTYLQGFNKVPCEAIENDFVNKNLVLNSSPFVWLQIKIKNKPIRKIKFYTMEAVGEEDKERMFVYDERDFYLAQWRNLRKIFRSIDYFKVK
ncbi:MAG: hypothetical protein ABIQ56_03745 [Chitinophagaceae bacterium]